MAKSIKNIAVSIAHTHATGEDSLLHSFASTAEFNPEHYTGYIEEIEDALRYPMFKAQHRNLGILRAYFECEMERVKQNELVNA